ncbi:MAG TPA: hypothetical protein VMU19_13240 [Bryobacteraceae bacterium]|nr:hypothetical protein [Bryobacteraceae bacterium]
MSQVFIPFLDGMLDCDCAASGSPCCQRGLLVANQAERDVLLLEYPDMGMFLLNDSGGQYAFQKFSPCWFLDDAGMCRIHAKHGYALKPLTCRLHPFYVFACGGEHVVVPHGCEPLRVVRPGQTSRFDQRVVLANAEEAIRLGVFETEFGLPPGRLEVEKEVLAASSAYLDRATYVDFAAYQIAMSRGSSASDARARLNEMLRLWKRYLGSEDLDLESREFTRDLTAVTPLLRVSAECLWGMDAESIAMALLALYFCLLMYSRGGPREAYVATYSKMLPDIPLGLIHLTEQDLQVASQPADRKIRWVRTLRKLHSGEPNQARTPRG